MSIDPGPELNELGNRGASLGIGNESQVGTFESSN